MTSTGTKNATRTPAADAEPSLPSGPFDGPWVVGKAYLIRTVTYFVLGRLDGDLRARTPARRSKLGRRYGPIPRVPSHGEITRSRAVRNARDRRACGDL